MLRKKGKNKAYDGVYVLLLPVCSDTQMRLPYCSRDADPVLQKYSRRLELASPCAI